MLLCTHVGPFFFPEHLIVERGAVPFLGLAVIGRLERVPEFRRLAPVRDGLHVGTGPVGWIVGWTGKPLLPFEMSIHGTIHRIRDAERVVRPRPHGVQPLGGIINWHVVKIWRFLVKDLRLNGLAASHETGKEKQNKN